MTADKNMPRQPQRIIVLGATGSIGKSLADIISRHPDRFEVVALVANSNAEGLADMALQLKAECAVLADASRIDVLKSRLDGSGIEVSAGPEAVLDAVERDADTVVGAIVGAAGLKPTLAAIKPGRRLALANKECLVCAGDLLMERVRETGCEILPVDSEHNAIFQVFEADKPEAIEKVILTASGGPFRTFSLAQMKNVTPEQALKHPNWDMGSRITIDSATMMNKGLEVIEAFHLFPVEADELGVLVHPQSVVHGMVQYRDGSLLAQMGSPDMRTPIAHCLAFPERIPLPVERLDLAAIGSLSFEAPDYDRFPALKLALSALDTGRGVPVALNAADEVAVAAFLRGDIGFLDIPAAIESVIEDLDKRRDFAIFTDIDSILDLDQKARRSAQTWVQAHLR